MMTRKKNAPARAKPTPIARIRAEIDAIVDTVPALRAAAIQWAEIALQ
jgi:hypothetical protein